VATQTHVAAAAVLTVRWQFWQQSWLALRLCGSPWQLWRQRMLLQASTSVSGGSGSGGSGGGRRDCVCGGGGCGCGKSGTVGGHASGFGGEQSALLATKIGNGYGNAAVGVAR